MLARLGMTRREAKLLAAIMVLGFAIRLAFVIATHGHALAGDEIEYDSEARFIAHGKWFWSTAPTGVPHAAMWKTPVYPAFVGILYKILGTHPDRVLGLQTLIGPVVIGLVWLLGRRLFGPRVAFAAAVVVAVCPFAWQFEVRLLGESLATPLTLLFLLVLLEHPPTPRRVALVGLVCGVVILTRPSSVYLLPVIAAAFVVGAGVRRGLLMTGAAVLVTALVIAPWSIRNHSVSGAWVLLSTQQVTPYGTFNDQSANDPKNPYAWRPQNKRDAPIIARVRELGEVEFAKKLRHNTTAYIKKHPFSVVEAFYWNGLTRVWDVRRPSHALDEAPFTGRPKWLAAIALGTYWVFLPLAICALWLLRRRWTVLAPVLALALSASIVFTAEGATRYRAPFDPLVALLGCFAAVTLLDGIRARRAETPVAPPAVA